MRKCETKAEAVAYAKVWQSLQSVTVSAMVVDDDNNEIVFPTGQAKELRTPQGLEGVCRIPRRSP